MKVFEQFTFIWSLNIQLLTDVMSGRKSKRECGKDKTLGAPSPLPGSCLATYRDVFLATEYEEGGEEACVEAVKDHLIHLFSKVTPTLSLIEDKSVIQKIQRCRDSVKRLRSNKLTAYQKAKFFENIDRIFNISKCQHKFRSCVNIFSAILRAARLKIFTLIAPAFLWIKYQKKKENLCKTRCSDAHWETKENIRCQISTESKQNVTKEIWKRELTLIAMRLKLQNLLTKL